MLCAVDGVGSGCRELVHVCKWPSVGAHPRGYDADILDLVRRAGIWMKLLLRTDKLLQPFQFPHDQSARRPSYIIHEVGEQDLQLRTHDTRKKRKGDNALRYTLVTSRN